MTLPDAFLSTPLAHRGLHDAGSSVPENCPGAFRRAVAAGYGIECDLQLSSDGVAMVFHDPTLDRMTAQTGPVRARKARELSDIPLGTCSDGIPTLSDVLELVAGRVPLLIEMKDQSDGRGGTDGALEAATAIALDGYDGPVALMSFNPAMVEALKSIAPHLPRGLTTCGFLPSQWPLLRAEDAGHLRSIRDFGRVGADFISHDWTDLGSPRVAELRAQGIPILCWTIRSPQEETEARRVADNITFEDYLPPIPPR
ncbi:phosphodiesterase [Rhodobacterales bacterium HKCCE3408]|nr:phosphodiesterase [Rhodobacterales bacterium HKCCE3408]